MYICMYIWTYAQMYKSFSIIDMYHKQENIQEENFHSFHSTTNLLPQIMALSISNISLQNCYSKSFTANSYFLLKKRKFSHTDVFPYMVCIKSQSHGDHRGLCNHINVNFNLWRAYTYNTLNLHVHTMNHTSSS